MKKIIVSFLLISIIGTHCVVGQVTAGSIPTGTSITNPYINLSVSTVYQSVSDSFDIDLTLRKIFRGDKYSSSWGN